MLINGDKGVMKEREKEEETIDTCGIRRVEKMSTRERDPDELSKKRPAGCLCPCHSTPVDCRELSFSSFLTLRVSEFLHYVLGRDQRSAEALNINREMLDA